MGKFLGGKGLATYILLRNNPDGVGPNAANLRETFAL